MDQSVLRQMKRGGFSRMWQHFGHVRSQAGAKEVFRLADLPESCVALTLTNLCPGDVSRLAQISRTWAEAAASDLVRKAVVDRALLALLKLADLASAQDIEATMKLHWRQGKLEPDTELRVRDGDAGLDQDAAKPAGQAESGALNVRSTAEAEIYESYTPLRRALAMHYPDGVLLSGGRQNVQLDPVSKRLRVSVSLAKLWHNGVNASLAGMESAFPEVLLVNMENSDWLNLGGIISCQLPPGCYRVSWRLGRSQTLHLSQRQGNGPLTLESRARFAGKKVDEVCQVPLAETLNALGPNHWVEVKAGEAKVEAAPRRSLGKVKLVVALLAAKCKVCIQGLYVDSLVFEEMTHPLPRLAPVL